MKHSEFFARADALSVKQAMRKLEELSPKIVFLLDGNRVCASLTDGDVRRYLLSGGQLDNPAMKAANPAPLLARSRKQAETLLNQRDKVAVPVTDSNGVPLELVSIPNDTHAAPPDLGIPVVIMAGGRGTRLDPYTRIFPKPLIPVGDLPIIEHIMLQFRQYGCNMFHIIVNYKKELMKAYFHENERQYQIHWYDEEKPLGTGGGLCMLKGKINGTFFLTNCDILVKSDYASILRFHREGKNAVTMIAANKRLTIPYGVVETRENGVIEAMREKPELSFLTNTGMYVVEPETLDDVPDNTPIGFPDIIERQREKGRKVSAYAVPDDEWMDMGQLEELEQMRKKIYGEP